MVIMRQYLVSTKNVPQILKAIRNGQAPERFTTRHVANLGFKSVAERQIIGILKGLGFLTDNGVPTPRYVQYLDETQSGAVLRQAIEEAYGDLFKIRKDAQNYTVPEARNKMKTLTDGKLTDTVLDKMARTFVALCKEADFSGIGVPRSLETDKSADDEHAAEEDVDRAIVAPATLARVPQLVYNIQVILPTTKDRAVYDAILRSLKEHILR